MKTNDNMTDNKRSVVAKRIVPSKTKDNQKKRCWQLEEGITECITKYLGCQRQCP